MKTYLITGGCGFIGSNFVRHLMASDKSSRIINLDKLTYAGNQQSLEDLADSSRYHFVHGDICDRILIEGVFNDYSPDVVINFAAESHVDRSIGKPDDFIQTDVFGVFVLLEAAKDHGIDLFLQISTDEVYGSIDDGSFSETDTLMPSSPYSASKAGGDRLAYSYFVTYRIPVIVTRASNNFGPYQYPEKLIPLFVTNALEDEPLPLYGDGKNVRDWIYVNDHCSAIDFLLREGELGETYNVGGGNEKQNVDITHLILKQLEKPESLMRYVEDRKGHDQRYSLNCDKIRSMGWEPKHSFEAALEQTIEWYKSHEEWWKRLKSGEFLEFYKSYYGLELT